MKTAALGLVPILILIAACSGQPKSDPNDRFAGLDEAIRGWKNQVAASDPSCKSKDPTQKCEMFEVSCKAERVIAPEETGKGVTAKVVADMSWSGFDDKGAGQPAAAAALFTRAKGAWTREAYKPVNPETCADL